MSQQARAQDTVRRQTAVSIYDLMETRFNMAGCQMYVVLDSALAARMSANFCCNMHSDLSTVVECVIAWY